MLNYCYYKVCVLSIGNAMDIQYNSVLFILLTFFC
ncbi:MAG: hypothetical protein S4CHLAM102_03300 [Chlamydiia bacterium]|nr:hypothetical protein [Chlamydiia bacterium]